MSLAERFVAHLRGLGCPTVPDVSVVERDLASAQFESLLKFILDPPPPGSSRAAMHEQELLCDAQAEVRDAEQELSRLRDTARSAKRVVEEEADAEWSGPAAATPANAIDVLQASVARAGEHLDASLERLREAAARLSDPTQRMWIAQTDRTALRSAEESLIKRLTALTQQTNGTTHDPTVSTACVAHPSPARLCAVRIRHTELLCRSAQVTATIAHFRRTAAQLAADSVFGQPDTPTLATLSQSLSVERDRFERLSAERKRKIAQVRRLSEKERETMERTGPSLARLAHQKAKLSKMANQLDLIVSVLFGQLSRFEFVSLLISAERKRMGKCKRIVLSAQSIGRGSEERANGSESHLREERERANESAISGRLCIDRIESRSAQRNLVQDQIRNKCLQMDRLIDQRRKAVREVSGILGEAASLAPETLLAKKTQLLMEMERLETELERVMSQRTQRVKKM